MPHQIRKLSLSIVQNVPSGSICWDAQTKGFGVQGNHNGTVTFVLKTRVRGRQRWVTIGRLGSPWTVDTARREALRVLAEAAAGRDPTEGKRSQRTASTFFEAVADEFLEQHGPKLKPRTRDVYRQLLGQHLKPALLGRPIAEVTPSDVAKLHARLADKPRAANHAVAVLSKVMSWAERHKLRPDGSNPCRGLEKYREIKRERFLSAAEFTRLGQVLDQAERSRAHGPFVIAAIRLLILTGARRSEILTLKWVEVDLDRRALLLPDSKTGAKTVHLNKQATEILAALPRLENNPYVLPGHVSGKRLSNLQRPWHGLRHLAGLDDVRLHDLRHSFASMSVSVGGSLPVIGRVLGHRQAQTTARYAHVADTLASDLVEAAGAKIANAMKRGAGRSAE